MRGVLLVFVVSCIPQNDPQPSPEPVTDLEPAVQLSANGNHTCAVLANGNGACWGINNWGQLGTSTSGNSADVARAPRWVPLDTDPIAFAAGTVHTCAIVEGGEVQCWGQSGFLGVDEECDTTQPCVVPPRPVRGLTAVGIAAASTSNETVPSHSTCAITTDHRVACWGTTMNAPAEMFDDDGFPLRDVEKLALGGGHGCALSNGAVYCWGDTRFGLRTGGTRAAHVDLGGVGRITDVAAGRGHTCVVTTRDELPVVMCWGLSTNGQAGGVRELCDYEECAEPQVISGIPDPIAVAAGELHTCALSSEGSAWCWGSDEFGQAGDKALTLESDVVKVAVGHVTSLSAGSAHTCALRDDGSVWCWGDNYNGQLGRGATP